MCSSDLLPMWLLFEAGLFFSRIIVRKRKEAEKAENSSSEDNQMTDDEMDAELDKAIKDERIVMDHSDAADNLNDDDKGKN